MGPTVMIALDLDMPILDHNMVISGYDVDFTLLKPPTLVDRFNCQRGSPLQDLAEHTRAAWVKMLRKHDWRGKIWR